MIRRWGLTVIFVALGAPVWADAHSDMCFQSAVTEMLPVPDGVIGVAACAAACQENDSCVAWNYRPHSFEPKTMAGDCRLMPDVYQTDASDKYFCGAVER